MMHDGEAVVIVASPEVCCEESNTVSLDYQRCAFALIRQSAQALRWCSAAVKSVQRRKRTCMTMLVVDSRSSDHGSASRSRAVVPVFIVWLVGQGLNTVISVGPRHSH